MSARHFGPRPSIKPLFDHYALPSLAGPGLSLYNSDLLKRLLDRQYRSPLLLFRTMFTSRELSEATR